METPLTHSPETTGAVSVAIISDDPEFGRMLMERWQTERFVPSFTLLGSDFGNAACSAACDLAVVGSVRTEKLSKLLAAVQTCAAVVFLAEDPAMMQLMRSEYPRVAVLRRHDAWPDTTVPLCCEILRRV